MSKEILVNELHRQARKNFKRRRFIQRGILDTWQIDLVEMIPYAKFNKGYKYMLTVIDVFSKYAHALPVKSKSGVDVTNVFKRIIELNKNKYPKNLHTDQGKEFYNFNFKNLMTELNINHYHTHSNMKASIVERFNRTLKNKMWKKFSLQGNYKWINILDELIKDYNNSYHRSIRMAPKSVNKRNEKILLNTVYNNLKTFKKGKYKINDFVRISKYKNVFEKGYTPNWSSEVFKVNKIFITNPITYQLEDLNGNIIKGGFYEEELMMTKTSNIYLIEKIIKRSGNKLFVKWLGFGKEYNSWVNKKDLNK